MHSAAPSRHPKYRTKLCRNFANGDCPFGQKCSFIHPAPGTHPSTSLAQYLFNWNALLLPQLLALSNQQRTLEEMSQRSPPRSQGSRLVHEDPSPTTSLLLSKSDSTSSDQAPQTRRSNRRKKIPCRHFLRTGGWCPAAGKCRFFHDVAALASADVQKAERAPPFAADTREEDGRSISGGVLMGIQSPSPPTVGQAHPEPPRYTDAERTQTNQLPYWPNCTWQPYQPYYATVPPTAAVPIRTATAPPSFAQQSVYPPPQPQARTTPPGEAQSRLPLGSYEVNGTIYFPTSMPSVPAPPPVPYQIPAHPLPYDHTVAPVYPYYAPVTLPAGYYDIPNQTTDTGPQTTFDPFASDPMKPSELPVTPRLEDYQITPVERDVLPPPISLPLAPNGDLGVTSKADKPTVTQEHEFPYRPPKDQRVGHARRISVNIKKHVRVNSG